MKRDETDERPNKYNEEKKKRNAIGSKQSLVVGIGRKQLKFEQNNATTISTTARATTK